MNLSSFSLNAVPRLSLADLQAHDPTARFQTSGETRVLCPLLPCATEHTNPARHRSLSVRGDTGVWHCHRCHVGGLLAEFQTARDASVLERGGGRERQARQQAILRTRLGGGSAANRITDPPVVADNEAEPAMVSGEPSAPVATLTWRDRIGPLLSLAGSDGADYLARRGVDGARLAAGGTALAFAPSFAQIPGVRRGRAAVAFFLHADGGTDILGARQPSADDDVFAMGDGAVAVHGRFLNVGGGGAALVKAQTFGKKTGVFRAGASVFGQTVVCEAPIDALSLEMCGVPSVALCGTSGGDAVLQKTCALGVAVAAFDADTAGDAGARRLAQTLRPVGGVVWRLTPPSPCKDWNDALLALGQARLTLWLFDELGWTAKVQGPTPAGEMLGYTEARARLAYRQALAEAATEGNE